jgi:hypothetical protein
MATVVFGDFEWESAKAAANAKKHGVTFEEAATAFDDPHAIASSAHAKRHLPRGECMKKAPKTKIPSEASLARYDFRRATRGRYAGRLRMGTPLRRLDDDLADLFPNSASVNAALRAIVALDAALPRKTSKRTTRSRRAA